MSSGSPFVAIVDPFSSGATLAARLGDRGVPCIAVISSPAIPARMRSRFDSQSFVAVIDDNGDVESTLESLGAYPVTHVLAGFESGVNLADRIAAQLGLPGNLLRHSTARRDKYVMLETIAQSGLCTPRQFRASDPVRAVEWVLERGSWPVVAKALRGVASEQVHLCTSADLLAQTCDEILATPDALGADNDGVLVQEYLVGPEYAVDIVSLDGHRKTTAFWEYSRQSGRVDGIGYDTMTLMPYKGDRQQQLESYAFSVLDSLGIDFGPAHCEVVWCDGRPVVLEVGARLSAGTNATLSGTCGGISQLDKTVELIEAPQRFLDSLGEEPALSKRAMQVFLMPGRSGRLVALHGLDTIEELPTVHSVSAGVRPGEALNRVSGMVTLISQDMHAMRRDAGIIREIERTTLFEIDE